MPASIEDEADEDAERREREAEHVALTLVELGHARQRSGQ
jgi:hypothetical protein